MRTGDRDGVVLLCFGGHAELRAADADAVGSMSD